MFIERGDTPLPLLSCIVMNKGALSLPQVIGQGDSDPRCRKVKFCKIWSNIVRKFLRQFAQYFFLLCLYTGSKSLEHPISNFPVEGSSSYVLGAFVPSKSGGSTSLPSFPLWWSGPPRLKHIKRRKSVGTALVPGGCECIRLEIRRLDRGQGLANHIASIDPERERER